MSAFKVMTFNVRGSFHDDGANRRATLNVETIQKYAPDILGLQEAQSGNLDCYERELTDYTCELGPLSIRQAENYHRVPVYWRSTRFEKLDSGGFYLSETPDSWSLGWESTLVRAATWVRLRDLTTSHKVVILNTHFPHERECDSTRAACAQLIVSQMATITAPDDPAVVMADFNASPESNAYQVFANAGYIDTYTAAGHTDTVNTFHGFQGADSPYNSGRIDWILLKKRCQGVQDPALRCHQRRSPAVIPQRSLPDCGRSGTVLMPKFAVYTIPPAASELYQRGSEILGYDVRTGEFLPDDNNTRATLPEFNPAWVAQPQTYGFHVTTGYSLYFEMANLPQIEAKIEHVLSCFGKGVDFTLTPHPDDPIPFWGENHDIIVLRCDPNPAMLMLHTLLTACVNPLGTGSNAAQAYAQKDPETIDPVLAHRVQHYFTPYMLDGWVPHFTLMMPYTGTQREAMRAALLKLFAVGTIPVESVCLLIRNDAETHYRFYREFFIEDYPAK